ncbi:MAG TPA: phosphoenolpyruvate--protein phosphotransferase [Steroidobacteraceae bacterium]|nr:phosphoenolpyruvate--protein phosphotransferase [Steroidobacteraceae bacterium]
MATLSLLAPLDGWAVPLADVPDPVFAGRLAGDGVGIDPTGSVLYAPCAGEIILPPRAHHAISVRTASGMTVMIHVGIDTVGLEGQFFEPLVAAGDSVQSGQPLMRFDLEQIARRASSAVTPIVLGADCTAQILYRTEHRRVLVGDMLLSIQERPAQEGATQAMPGDALRFVLRVPYDHGLHARPAALLVAALRPFKVQARAEANGRTADMRSATALMSLGVRLGDPLQISLFGPDAHAAQAALEQLLTAPEKTAGAPAAPRSSAPSPPESNPDQLRGVTAVSGLAIGPAVKFLEPPISVVESGAGPQAERQALGRARSAVRDHLTALIAKAGAAQRAILEAHVELIDDPQLIESAELYLSEGKSAGYAWRAAARQIAERLRGIGDVRMAERAADLLDLESQVLRVLRGEAPNLKRSLPEQAIIIAEELLPSQLLGLELQRVAGIAMAGGGPTSHVAIIAAAHDIPVLVAIGARAVDIAAGGVVILDAEHGYLQRAPSAGQLLATQQELTRRAAEKLADRKSAQAHSLTTDGVRITVYSNIGAVAEASVAVAQGAEGCGLLRTEFLFLERSQAPNEDEQAEHYQQIANALGGRPLTIRTLDAGGDKPIPYLPLPHEDNPALGLRGIRTSLHYPQLLQTQLRAILRVEPAGQCRIMLPMITGLGEVRTVRAALEEARRALGKDRVPALGIMIETPASALLAEQLAAEVDFFSLGTNDLSQYTLAMDRSHAQLAAELDALHPAVLRLIGTTAAAGHDHGREVAVCGALGSDPVAVPLLIGLGIREISAVPALIPRLKSLIRKLDTGACRQLAQEALKQIDGPAVRALVKKWQERC